MGKRQRRPRFRDQTLGAILWSMVRAIVRPQPAGTFATRKPTHQQPMGLVPEADDTARGILALPLVVIIGVLVAVVAISIVVLVNIFSASSGTVLQVTPGLTSPTPSSGTGVAPQATPLAPVRGATSAVLQMYGGGLSGGPLFVQPQEAVQAPGGLLYVADTGNHRVVELNKAGHLVRSITSTTFGSLQSPYSLALTPAGNLLVLDSDAGQIFEYNAAGAQLRASGKELGLGHARGIATDHQGNVYVANTPANTVVTLSADLTKIAELPGTASDGTQRFSQPSAVAVAADGTLYVVDSQNSRLVQLSLAGALLHTWPLRVPDTLHSPRVLPLPGGRALVTDPPGGNILLYSAAGTQPVAYAISPGGPTLIPLGIASAGKDRVLVACYGTDQVVVVPLPAK